MRSTSTRTALSAASIAAPTPTRPDASRQSRNAHRFVALPTEDPDLDEKYSPVSSHLPSSSPRRSTGRSVPTPSAAPAQRACSSSRSRPSTPTTVQHTYGYPAPTRTPLPAPCTLSTSAAPSLGRRAWEAFKPWIPISLWVATSLGFLLAIAFWRTEVFNGLDQFSHWLKGHGYGGYAVLGLLIWVTTIPPFPLYSTFMMLSGYCFGAWPGAVVSYTASLSGAVCVFLLSRAYLRDYISSFFERSPSFKRVVRAIERRPNVLFLVRLAPYPYNVMNVLLAASPTLSLRTYTTCTGLALFKVIIHTTIGASIHSFSHQGSNGKTPATGEPDSDTSDGSQPEDEDEGESTTMSRALQIGGIVLCVGVFLYISWVARRAVDNEADDEDSDNQNAEEREAFLESGARPNSSEMTEANLGGEPRSIARMSIAEDATADIVVVPTPTPSPRPQGA